MFFSGLLNLGEKASPEVVQLSWVHETPPPESKPALSQSARWTAKKTKTQLQRDRGDAAGAGRGLHPCTEAEAVSSAFHAKGRREAAAIPELDGEAAAEEGRPKAQSRVMWEIKWLGYDD